MGRKMIHFDKDELVRITLKDWRGGRRAIVAQGETWCIGTELVTVCVANESGQYQNIDFEARNLKKLS